MDTLVATRSVKLTAPATAPATAPVPKAAPKAGGAPGRDVDVALFRNLPLAGSPMVSAAADKTLGSMDPIAKLLSKLETRGGIFAKLTGGIRLFTRFSGPTMWGVSVGLNVGLLVKALKDPTISGASKVALTVGTVTNALGAGAAAIAALPAKFAGRIGVGLAGQLTANKFAGLFGGIGGMIFNTINMVETLRDKDAMPAGRFFAKAGFALGALGFVASTIALTASLPFMAPLLAAAPVVLPIATTAATWCGIGGAVVLVGQLFFGKNRWLGDKVKGTILG